MSHPTITAALRKALEKLNAMPAEEFTAMLDKGEVGDVGQIILDMYPTPTPTVGELETVAWTGPNVNGDSISEKKMAEYRHGAERGSLFSKMVMDFYTVELVRKSAALAHNEAIRGALEKALDWMEELRASGDAGNWDWKPNDLYNSGRALLASQGE